jgi:membrane-associated protease RseP (regulator of RpoE activity)
VDGEPVASYDELARLLADIEEPVTLRLEAGLSTMLLVVEAPVTLPDDGDRGFLGLGPEEPRRDVGPVAGVWETTRTMGNIVWLTGEGLGKLFSPSGLAGYADLVAESTTEGSQAGASDEPRLRLVDGGGEARAVVDEADAARPISIYGIVRIGGAYGSEYGLAAVLGILASVNLVLALINLVPLPPFDGGHAAVATYEAVVGAIKRRPYRVDMAKLMPLTYAVVLLLLFVGLSSIWLDVRNPIELP